VGDGRQRVGLDRHVFDQRVSTFSLSMIGMAFHWYQQRGKNAIWLRRFALFVFGATLCLSILAVNLYFKVILDLYHVLASRPEVEEAAGHAAEQPGHGWMTIAVTGLIIGTCFLIRRYYDRVRSRLQSLDETLGTLSGGESLAARSGTYGGDSRWRIQRSGRTHAAERGQVCAQAL
jgi:hypothetical protein